MNQVIIVNDKRFSMFMSHHNIKSRINDLANAMKRRYQGKKPVFVIVLNGAFIFASDLIRQIDFDCELAFVKISSYSGTESSGIIRTELPLQIDLKDRHVIVIEDIVDSGLTLSHFLPSLRELAPASLAVCALLVKPEAIQHQVEVDFRGFDIPTRFVVGYGLDYDGYGRNLKDIYQLNL